VIGTFLVVAEPAFRANETAGEANNAKNAKATVTEVIDMGGAPLWFGRFAMLCCGHSMGPMIPFFFGTGSSAAPATPQDGSRKRSPQSFVAARYDVMTAGRELGYSCSD
jgi:hypothetical protein